MILAFFFFNLFLSLSFLFCTLSTSAHYGKHTFFGAAPGYDDGQLIKWAAPNLISQITY